MTSKSSPRVPNFPDSGGPSSDAASSSAASCRSSAAASSWSSRSCFRRKSSASRSFLASSMILSYVSWRDSSETEGPPATTPETERRTSGSDARIPHDRRKARQTEPAPARGDPLVFAGELHLEARCVGRNRELTPFDLAVGDRDRHLGQEQVLVDFDDIRKEEATERPDRSSGREGQDRQLLANLLRRCDV